MNHILISVFSVNGLRKVITACPFVTSIFDHPAGSPDAVWHDVASIVLFVVRFASVIVTVVSPVRQETGVVQ